MFKDNNKCQPRCEEIRTPYIADGHVKWCNNFGQHFGSFLKSQLQTCQMMQQFYS